MQKTYFKIILCFLLLLSFRAVASDTFYFALSRDNFETEDRDQEKQSTYSAKGYGVSFGNMLTYGPNFYFALETNLSKLKNDNTSTITSRVSESYILNEKLMIGFSEFTVFKLFLGPSIIGTKENNSWEIDPALNYGAEFSVNHLTLKSWLYFIGSFGRTAVSPKLESQPYEVFINVAGLSQSKGTRYYNLLTTFGLRLIF